MDPTAEGAAGAEGLPAVPWFLASRRRLSLTLFLALAAPMAGLGLIAAERARRTLRDQALTQDAAAAGLAAQMVGEHFAGLARHLEVVARRPALVDAAGRKDAAAARAQLRDLLELDPSFDRAFVADAAGVEWADEPTDPAAIGQDLSARDWYRGASGTGATYVSGVGRRSGGKRIMTVAVATPIRDARGGTAGYLVAHHPL
ncbi:MAG TPA: cache domain-containing protein, partial [Isosphaeraceae bacterium]